MDLLTNRSLRYIGSYAKIIDLKNGTTINKLELISRIDKSLSEKKAKSSEFDRLLLQTSVKITKLFVDTFLKDYKVA